MQIRNFQTLSLGGVKLYMNIICFDEIYKYVVKLFDLESFEFPNNRSKISIYEKLQSVLKNKNRPSSKIERENRESKVRKFQDQIHKIVRNYYDFLLVMCKSIK